MAIVTALSRTPSTLERDQFVHVPRWRRFHGSPTGDPRLTGFFRSLLGRLLVGQADRTPLVAFVISYGRRTDAATLFRGWNVGCPCGIGF